MTEDRAESATSLLQRLKFATEHIQPIVRGKKTATIRLELDKGFPLGSTFQLCDENGHRFASATVSDRGYNDARSIVAHGVEGHCDYRDVDEFLEQMAEYYPDAELTPDTCFEIVYWEDLWE